jgi:hypothetical protein
VLGSVSMKLSRHLDGTHRSWTLLQAYGIVIVVRSTYRRGMHVAVVWIWLVMIADNAPVELAVLINTAD